MKPLPMVKLGEVLKQVRREVAVDPVKTYRLLGVRWYGEGLFAKEQLSGQEIRAAKLYRVEGGDFVYNRLFAWKGSFALAMADVAGSHVSNEFPCFVPNSERIELRFLLWYFRRQSAWTAALGLSTGATPTSRNRLKEELFLRMEIPLPPLAEQRRIVMRIEELCKYLAEAKSRRAEATDEAQALSISESRRQFALAGQIANMRMRIVDICEEMIDYRGRTPPTCEAGIPHLTSANIKDGRIDWQTNRFGRSAI
jgi:type I restriction enzyme S subunit